MSTFFNMLYIHFIFQINTLAILLQLLEFHFLLVFHFLKWNIYIESYAFSFSTYSLDNKTNAYENVLHNLQSQYRKLFLTGLELIDINSFFSTQNRSPQWFESNCQWSPSRNVNLHQCRWTRRMRKNSKITQSSQGSYWKRSMDAAWCFTWKVYAV